MAEDAFEKARRELLGLDPKAFTARRNALSKELTRAGDPASARKVKALKRPTVTVSAVNQYLRSDRVIAADLLPAAERVADAQRYALSGKGGDRLRDEQRYYLDALRKHARAAAKAAGLQTVAQLQKIQDTMQAASSSDDKALRSAFARGELEEDLIPRGFGGLIAGGPPTLKAAKPARAGKSKAAKVSPPAEPRGPSAAERKRLERAYAKALSERERAEARLEDGKRAAREAAEAAHKAEQHAHTLRARAEAEERTLFELNRRLAEAETAEAEAKRQLPE